MTILYEYRLSGRRWSVWLSAAVCVLMGTLMAMYSAALIIWVPVLFGAGMIGWALIYNPVRGLRITEDELIMSPWKRPHHVPLDQIKCVQFTSWTDSEDMHLHLRSGQVIAVSDLDAPARSALLPVLAEIAIPVKER